MESQKDSILTHELLRILGQFPSKLASMEPVYPASIHIRSHIRDARGTTTALPEIWLQMTRIGSVPSGQLGAGNTVVEAILCISESEDSRA